MAYFSTQDLQKAIERKLGKSMSWFDWEIIRMSLYYEEGASYIEEEDLDDDMPHIQNMLRFLAEHKPEEQVAEANRGQATGQLFPSIRETDYEGLRWELLETKNIELKEREERIESLRHRLGLKDIIPPRLIEGELLRLGAQENESPYPLPYTKFLEFMPLKPRKDELRARRLIESAFSDYVGGKNQDNESRFNLQRFAEVLPQIRAMLMLEGEKLPHPLIVYDVHYLYIPRKKENNILWNLREIIWRDSIEFNCHPALVLLNLLCNYPLLPKDTPKIEVIKNKKNLQIYVGEGYLVSPSEVARQYREVRNELIAKQRSIKGDWARPRKASYKTSSLLDLCSEMENQNWTSRFEQWNTKYPNWRFRDIKSMQIAFYKARAREKRRLKQ